MGFPLRLSESVVFDPRPLDIEVAVPPVVIVPGMFVPVVSLLLSPLVLLDPPFISSALELLLASIDEFDSSSLLEEDVPVDEVVAVCLGVELRERLSVFSLDCVPWTLEVSGREEVAILLDDPAAPVPSAAPLEDLLEDCADVEELLKIGKPAIPVLVNEPRELDAWNDTEPIIMLLELFVLSVVSPEVFELVMSDVEA